MNDRAIKINISYNLLCESVYTIYYCGSIIMMRERERESKKGTCTEPFVAGETRNVTVMNTHQAGIEFLGESILRGLLGLEKNV